MHAVRKQEVQKDILVCHHRLPASEDPGVYTAQRTLLEAWQIVSEAYEDGSFNGRNWVRAPTLQALVDKALSEPRNRSGKRYTVSDVELWM